MSSSAPSTATPAAHPARTTRIRRPDHGTSVIPRRAGQPDVPRRRGTLLRPGQRLVLRAEALLGHDVVAVVAPELDQLVDRIDALSDEIGERLCSSRGPAAPGAAPHDLSAMLHELQHYRAKLIARGANERLDRLAAVEAGLAQLRFVQDPAELLDQVCEALVTSCGFDRAMLSRVEDSTWHPWKSHSTLAGDVERVICSWVESRPTMDLGRHWPEAEMVRRRAPAVVTREEDVARLDDALGERSGVLAYVGAPLLPGDRVIGFLHADCEGAYVDELDRDVLWAFARGFSQIFERATLITRLRTQRDEVKQAMRTVEHALAALESAEIAFGRRRQDDAPQLVPTTILPVPGSAAAGRLELLLTPRELEVLALMATGATNLRIAEQLVISDGTVKSHVKRILRKLRAANRSEAVARYLRMTMTAPARV